MFLARQGDVMIMGVDEIPEGLEKIKPGVRGYVLAEGEATGHAHTLNEVQFAQMWKGSQEEDPDLFLKTDKACTVVHEEHGTINLPEGTFLVRRQREYSPEEIRKVQD